MKTYFVNEIFYSVQGEGVRAGTANLFLRFAGCNRSCRVESHGFDCDTDFSTGRRLSIDQIVGELRAAGPHCPWVLLTGGEPALQVDRELIDALHAAGWQLAIETNGSITLPPGLDWITVSPKDPEEAIRQRTADEVKYVRACGQPLPQTVVRATHRLLSPASQKNEVDRKALEWCIRLVKHNPDWRLSVQQHKWWGIR